MFNFLENTVIGTFKRLGVEGDPILKASPPIYGDFQINGVMAIAKKQKVNPMQLAEKIAQQLPREFFQTVEIVAPGFINLKLKNDFIAEQLKNIFNFKNESLKVVIDYSSPNLAKEMHVGHLRSTIIGDALVRIHRFLGNQVIKRNHVGDWGTQFGMLLAHLASVSTNQQEIILKDLESFYCQAKLRFDQDQDFVKLTYYYVNLLQKKDPEVYSLWQKFLKISLEHCGEIYQRLGVDLTPEDVWGESAYNDDLPLVVKQLLEQKIAVINKEAVCVFFEEGELPHCEQSPFIIQKKDGSYLYATTDLAAAYDRINNLKADLILYVIDARQSLHLQQLFATLKKAGKLEKTKCKHVAFGVMLGSNGKPFKTRDGGTVKLNDLLNEAQKYAFSLLTQRNSSIENLLALGEKLGIAAIKYADLAKNRTSDYQFNLTQMLNFEGNTASYLLYALVRIKSVLRKNQQSFSEEAYLINDDSERILALQLLKFKEAVLLAARDSFPHLICNYLYELSSIFMHFYETTPILENVSRLTLTKLTEKVLSTGLSLLGIPILEKM